MNLKEIIDLPNQISIPLLIHKCKITGVERKKIVEKFFIHYKSLRYLLISYKRPIEFMFELIYKEELYASSSHPQIFGGSIQYSQFKEIYDSVNDLDNNQFILTYGKDPFNLKGDMEDFIGNVCSDIFEEVKQFLMEIASG